MNVTLKRKAAFFAVLGVAGLLKVVHVYGTMPTTISMAQNLGLPLSVMFDSTNMDPNTQQIYQNMQNSLDGSTFVPNDRTNYYSAVYNVNGFAVSGWQSIITNVQPNADGSSLVTIDVLPCMSSDAVGACSVVLDSDYSEQYQVFGDGTFQYVGSLDPQGLAGQMPLIVGL